MERDAVRCYLMIKGHIGAVEFLAPGPDETMVREAHAHFERRTKDQQFDGFEVWDGARRVYVWPVEHSEAVLK